MLVRNLDRSTTATALYLKGANVISGEEPAVMFNVYGAQRFLSMIRTSKGNAVTLGQGRQERGLASVQGAPAIASIR